jgi:hypothetical protein
VVKARTTSTRRRRLFLAAVAADQQETDRFLGAFAGIVPPERYFTTRTAMRVLGCHLGRRQPHQRLLLHARAYGRSGSR